MRPSLRPIRDAHKERPAREKSPVGGRSSSTASGWPESVTRPTAPVQALSLAPGGARWRWSHAAPACRESTAQGTNSAFSPRLPRAGRRTGLVIVHISGGLIGFATRGILEQIRRVLSGPVAPAFNTQPLIVIPVSPRVCYGIPLHPGSQDQFARVSPTDAAPRRTRPRPRSPSIDVSEHVWSGGRPLHVSRITGHDRPTPSVVDDCCGCERHRAGQPRHRTAGHRSTSTYRGPPSIDWGDGSKYGSH